MNSINLFKIINILMIFSIISLSNTIHSQSTSTQANQEAQLSPTLTTAWKFVDEPKNKYITTTAQWRTVDMETMPKIEIRIRKQDNKYYLALIYKNRYAYYGKTIDQITLSILINGEIQNVEVYFDEEDYSVEIKDYILSVIQEGSAGILFVLNSEYDFSLDGFNEALKLLD